MRPADRPSSGLRPRDRNRNESHYLPNRHVPPMRPSLLRREVEFVMAPGRGLIVRIVCVAVVATAAALYFLSRGGGQGSVSEPHVILISIDTCRADHLGCYDSAKDLTPNIDRFARKATVLANCVAPTPLTVPSHATMLTGRIPLAHGVHKNAPRVDPAEVTLAEILRDRGYATGAVVSHVVLSRPFGLDQGFGVYLDQMGDSGAVEGERRGEATSALAVNWLRRNTTAGPAFLFVHYFDPHEPYLASGEFAKRHEPGQAGQYAAEIAYVDHCIGRLLEALRKLDIYDSSLIILTGDHGEMLGEHGEGDHGYFIYESAIKVPLIVKLPQQRTSRRVEDIVGLVDIMPTVCSALGIEPPPDIQGRDLGPLLRGEPAPDEERYLYCESVLPRTFYNAHPLLGLVGPRWKYIHSARPELYDLAADAQEADNLAEAEPRRTRALAEQLQAVFATFADVGGGEQVDLDARTLELLASVGYVGLERRVDVAFDAAGDDAKDLIDLHNAFHHELRALRGEGKVEKAIAMCRELIAQRPEATECYSVLASMLIATDRRAEAVEVYGTAIELSPGDAFLLLARGRLYMTLSRPAEAAADFREASKLSPTHTGSLVALGQALRETESFDQAEDAYLGALAINPREVSALGNLVLLYLDSLDTPEKALPMARRLLDIRPKDPRTQETYGWALVRGGDYEAGLRYLQAVAERSPTADTHYRLGWTFQQQGRLSEALVRYRAAAELLADRQDDPLHATVAEAIEQLENR